LKVKATIPYIDDLISKNGWMRILQEQIEMPEQRACESEAHVQTQETQERTHDNHPVEHAKHGLQEGDGPVFTAD